jgi:hypothetical protein
MTANLEIGFNNKFINNSSYTKFMGVIIDNTLPWKNHIDLLVKKLLYTSKCQNIHVCLIIEDDLLCLFSFGYELWDYVLGELVAQLCDLQTTKKAIRIMEECGNRVSCRNLFKKL